MADNEKLKKERGDVESGSKDLFFDDDPLINPEEAEKVALHEAEESKRKARPRSISVVTKLPKSKKRKAFDYDIKEETDNDKKSKKKKKAKAKPKKEKKEKKVRSSGYIAMVLALTISILLNGIMLFANYIKYVKMSKVIVLEKSDYKINSSDYVYVNEEIEVGNDAVKLEKMQFNAERSLFYFDKNFSLNDYAISICDKDYISYNIDLSYVENYMGLEDFSSVVAFEPLPNDVEIFDLTLINLQSGLKKTVTFEVKGDFKRSPVAIIGRSAVEFKSFKKEIVISHVNFSDSETKINYYFDLEGKDFSYRFKNPEDTSNITLYENDNKTVMVALNKNDTFFEDANIIAQECFFKPVKSFGSDFKVEFQNLFRVYKINRHYQPSDFDMNNPLKVKLDYNTVTFEGIEKRDGIVVLVLHGNNDFYYPELDKNLAKKKELYGEDYDYLSRAETIIDVELVGVDSSGEPFTVKGDVKSKDIGTDVVFRDKRLTDIELDSLKVKVNSIDIQTQDVNYEFNVPSGNISNESTSLIDMNNFITDAFDSRNAYKASEISYEDIKGFSDQIMEDEKLMNLYNPIDVDSRARYFSGVIMGTRKDDKYMANVMGIWSGSQGNEVYNYMYLHEVTLEKDYNGDFIITKDTITNY